MFKRNISKTISKAAEQFSVIVLTGPRQSGKTTLLKTMFPGKKYINLEDPETLERVTGDPKAFFGQDAPEGWIVDEAQKFPKLFSFIQVWVDEDPKKGRFILSGSQNFLLLQGVTQTLAGRSAIFDLLPLSYDEFLSEENQSAPDLYDYLFHGSYPRIYHEKPDLELWYNSYIRTYLERDVRSTLQIKDLAKFQLFLRLCAGRHGQQLNLNSLGQECGISQPTAQSWLSILEASYIVFRIQPFHKNLNKRLVKTPKLYFYDSAIVCRLLGIDSKDHLAIHSSLGAIFEGFVLCEIKKFFANLGKPAPLYFWQSHGGHEIDALLEFGQTLWAFEIKSTQTFKSNLLDNLEKWRKIYTGEDCQQALVYGGDDEFSSGQNKIIPWKKLPFWLGKN